VIQAQQARATANAVLGVRRRKYFCDFIYIEKFLQQNFDASRSALSVDLAASVAGLTAWKIGAAYRGIGRC
jgi:hypothetical protein